MLPPEVSFTYVSNMVRWVGQHQGMGHPSHSPSHIGYWGPLEDNAEGRASLGERLREIAQYARGIVHDDRIRTVLQWGSEQGLLEVPIALPISKEAN